MARPLCKIVLAVAFAKKPVNILSYSELSMIMSFFSCVFISLDKGYFDYGYFKYGNTTFEYQYLYCNFKYKPRCPMACV